MSSVSEFTAAPFPQKGMRPPHCTFVTGPRNSGKTRYILGALRKIAMTSRTPEGTVCALLAEDGRTRSENLTAALAGLILRKLFFPCQCCPELARLPANLRAIAAANPRLEHVFIEIPDVAALRIIEEFDSVMGWPRSVVACINPAWAKARRLGMLSPFQSALLDMAGEIIISELPPESPALAKRDKEPSPTTAPFHLTLP